METGKINFLSLKVEDEINGMKIKKIYYADENSIVLQSSDNLIFGLPVEKFAELEAKLLNLYIFCAQLDLYKLKDKPSEDINRFISSIVHIHILYCCCTSAERNKLIDSNITLLHQEICSIFLEKIIKKAIRSYLITAIIFFNIGAFYEFIYSFARGLGPYYYYLNVIFEAGWSGFFGVIGGFLSLRKKVESFNEQKVDYRGHFYFVYDSFVCALWGILSFYTISSGFLGKIFDSEDFNLFDSFFVKFIALIFGYASNRLSSLLEQFITKILGPSK